MNFYLIKDTGRAIVISLRDKRYRTIQKGCGKSVSIGKEQSVEYLG